MKFYIELSGPDPSDIAPDLNVPLWTLRIADGERSEDNPPIANIVRLSDHVMRDPQYFVQCIWITAARVWQRRQGLIEGAVVFEAKR